MSTVCVIKLEFFLQLKAALTILSVIIKVIFFLEKEDTLIKKRRRFVRRQVQMFCGKT